ncbi:hypothetical protein N0V86_007925 [Didymella sp. IMI 355093]|nr:hypothetical protein N0V86_007925 [Didymella sp. IMI 355093]
MFTAPAPAAPTVSATPISPVSPSPRSTGLQRGISFLRNYTHGLHLHSTDGPDGPRALSMTRTRAETAAPQLTVRNSAGPTPTSTPRPNDHDSSSDNAAEGSTPQKHLPSIRFIPHQDPRAGRPSLQFPTITRTLPDESAVVRVGRYSERDNAPEIPANTPSAAAIGFKSKVVSRKHCELWCKDGNWYIKDVKSSSGTFLNHIRLSQPNVESKPFRIKDGDIVQLGIDFRGGEEMIFRCVKIRVECNRGWQQGLNSFKPILNGATWPNFLCPNCRAVADLDADVEDPGEFEDWEEDPQTNGNLSADAQPPAEDRHVTPRASVVPLNGTTAENGRTDLSDLQQAITGISIHEPPANPQTPFRPIEPMTASVTQAVSIDRGPDGFNGLSPLYLASHDGLAPDRVHDGPMTPRNDAGPFVLDGSAGRAGSRLRDESPGSGETDTPSIPPVRFD